jgi:hypothetical protein
MLLNGRKAETQALPALPSYLRQATLFAPVR